MVATSPHSYSFSRPQEGFAEKWTENSAMARLSRVVSSHKSPNSHPLSSAPRDFLPIYCFIYLPGIHSQDGMYETLFRLADLPGFPDIREEAVQVLQRLPTCPTTPEQLKRSLALDIGISEFFFDQGQIMQPAKLLYSLQVSCFSHSFALASSD